jgi:tripartite ATP-independent transporter DctP family solute receptor
MNSILAKKSNNGANNGGNNNGVPMPFWKSRFWFAVRALCLGLLALQPAVAQESDAVRLEIADYRAYLSDTHPVRQGMRKFAELVRAKGGGKLQVNVRTDALPGSPAEQIDALQKGGPGVPAMMLVASTGLVKLRAEFAVLDLPFLVRDQREADFLLDGAFGNALLERLASTNLVGLSWWENGFRQVTTSGPAIVRAEDFRDVQFRVIAEPVFVDTFRAIGANPVPLPFAGLYEALKAKSVQAQDNFCPQILAGRLYEVQSSLSMTNHSYSPLVLVANADVWRRLTPGQRRVLQEAAIDAGRFQREANRQDEAAVRARLVAAGMRIHTLPAVELEKMESLTRPVRAQYFEKADAGLLKLYQAEIIKYRSRKDDVSKGG